MSDFSYERQSPKLIKVLRDGVFAGFLKQSWKTAPTGLATRGHTFWQGRIADRDIRSVQLRNAKGKIEGRIHPITGKTIISGNK